jgi:hypothetical protein
MNPLGIGLAFTLFWAAIGLGLFLTFNGFIGLGKARRVYGITAEHSATHVVSSLSYAIMLVIGLVLVVAGAYANYVVLYR